MRAGVFSWGEGGKTESESQAHRGIPLRGVRGRPGQALPERGVKLLCETAFSRRRSAWGIGDGSEIGRETDLEFTTVAKNFAYSRQASKATT